MSCLRSIVHLQVCLRRHLPMGSRPKPQRFEGPFALRRASRLEPQPTIAVAGGSAKALCRIEPDTTESPPDLIREILVSALNCIDERLRDCMPSPSERFMTPPSAIELYPNGGGGNLSRQGRQSNLRERHAGSAAVTAATAAAATATTSPEIRPNPKASPKRHPSIVSRVAGKAKGEPETSLVDSCLE